MWYWCQEGWWYPLLSWLLHPEPSGFLLPESASSRGRQHVLHRLGYLNYFWGHLAFRRASYLPAQHGCSPTRLVATYLDDVVIYSNSVLTIYNASSECSIFLHSASLTAKPKQNFLAIKATMFLSPIIGGGAFVQTRSSWRQCWHGLCPQQSAQYAPFFKLCGYYRQFSPNFATLVDECHCKCSTQSGGMVRWLWGVFCVLK